MRKKKRNLKDTKQINNAKKHLTEVYRDFASESDKPKLESFKGFVEDIFIVMLKTRLMTRLSNGSPHPGYCACLMINCSSSFCGSLFYPPLGLTMTLYGLFQMAVIMQQWSLCTFHVERTGGRCLPIRLWRSVFRARLNEKGVKVPCAPLPSRWLVHYTIPSSQLLLMSSC